eukprot:Protomagalhaensia_sp_Gyna_25__3204@NODE_291_length_4029_cov_11_141604_g225_i0_p1_GENE_NODE_291_length_4029_cov_11_141604_g225_i0NODE_291_length_4029_cov_11_141604_g225_i0_p1_ORF_typecomplete_len632_score96_71TPR_9/PF13371_6/1_1e02TPR_9/PF13371_6/1_2e05TPR_9/PF13371_6/7_5e05TPR_9/PF13371_6/1_9e06TPR_9/PF13371_6/9_8e08TPR_9/PF13371_6/2_3e06TPR_16/PF13432_6/65TPR_16/PF13432_6/7_3e06TPR_16/PF13432_6/0_0043TPR_16/PF13432_6/21TPR_16/PF13432_6/8e07TPR_16/PF13432_6/0_0032TPR_16/PF13432_6/0_00013TPR_16/P
MTMKQKTQDPQVRSIYLIKGLTHQSRTLGSCLSPAYQVNENGDLSLQQLHYSDLKNKSKISSTTESTRASTNGKRQLMKRTARRYFTYQRSCEGYYDAALREMKLRRYAAALALLQQARQEHVGARILACDCFSKLGRAEAALRQADMAVSLAPENGLTWHRKGKCLAAMKKWLAAGAAFERAAQLAPDVAEICADRGRNFVRLRDLAAAAENADRAVCLAPHEGTCWSCRSAVLLSLGQPKAALQAVNEAIKRDPQEATWRLQRGSLHFRFREYKLALEDGVAASELDPRLADAWYLQGLCWGALEEWRLARHVFDKAVLAAPNNAKGFHYRAIVQLKLKQFAAAAKDASKATDLYPDRIQSWKLKAVALGKLQNWPAMKDALDQAICRGANHSDYFYHRAVAEYKLKDFQAALQDCQQALTLNPRHMRSLKLNRTLEGVIPTSTGGSSNHFGESEEPPPPLSDAEGIHGLEHISTAAEELFFSEEEVAQESTTKHKRSHDLPHKQQSKGCLVTQNSSPLRVGSSSGQGSKKKKGRHRRHLRRVIRFQQSLDDKAEPQRCPRHHNPNHHSPSQAKVSSQWYGVATVRALFSGIADKIRQEFHQVKEDRALFRPAARAAPRRVVSMVAPEP